MKHILIFGLASGCLLVAGTALSQRLLTLPDLSVLEPRGDTLQVTQVVPTPDGGHLIGGRFSYWYEGKRRFDLLKLKADGSPDTAWAPALSYDNLFANGALISVTPTPVGAFVFGDFQGVNGAATEGIALIDWTAAALPWPTITPRSRVFAISSYDRTGDWVYFNHALNGHYRMSGSTGRLDANWNSPRLGGCTRADADYDRLLADGGGRLWLRQFFSYLSMEEPGWVSVSRCDIQPATGIGNRGVVNRGLSVGEAVEFFDVTDEHVFLQRRRYRIADLSEDTAWPRLNTLRVTASFAYAIAESNSATVPTVLMRHAIVDGLQDTAWRYAMPVQYAAYRAKAQAFWWFAGSQGADSAGLLVTDRDAASRLASHGFMVKDDGKVEPDVTVVEYYVPALKHYFLTGRRNEQAALDALPASFSRTGMTFAAKSSKYRDIPEQPVCRMYASPENGMSNSHFYGIGEDCKALNKLTGLKYEGYDFSIQRPDSAQACPVGAPHGITRLFNNRASANDGNHRYVVSAATKAKMLAQGWLDEGVVFCSSAVTDANG
ncbi:MAG: delta-60 repeat domain-containing protein [Burkholderiales bacterium]|nr:delta-60 repeat domain-containing protein [Burkholderiales bacterium]